MAFFICIQAKGEIGDSMTIEKVINNNVVTAIDESNEEVVLMGKGIGFQAKSGEIIPQNKIEKKFVLSGKAEIGKFEEVVSSIPLEHLDVCIEIINYATNILGKRLSSSIYISLTDHINFALERYKTGIIFDNPLAQEVKSFYRSEYLVGEYAVRMIESKLSVQLPSDEAASIAMHFVNAEYNTGMSDTMQITTIIREVLCMVEHGLNVKLDDSEMHCARFIAHLKFMALRMVHEEQIMQQEEEYNNMVISLYPEAYFIANEIARYTKEKYNYTMKIDELVNMTIHIRRIQKNIEKG